MSNTGHYTFEWLYLIYNESHHQSLYKTHIISHNYMICQFTLQHLTLDDIEGSNQVHWVFSWLYFINQACHDKYWLRNSYRNSYMTSQFTSKPWHWMIFDEQICHNLYAYPCNSLCNIAYCVCNIHSTTTRNLRGSLQQLDLKHGKYAFITRAYQSGEHHFQ